MADYIVWNSRFSVSVAALDAEHQRIIGIINRMFEAKNHGVAQAALEKALGELTHYAMTHFAHEERILGRLRYHDWKKHRLEHRGFVKKISVLRMNYLVDPARTLDDLFEYLKTWWLHHILAEDRKYGPFMNARGVK